VDSLAGKILRVDPITGLGLPDNPFAEADLSTNQSKVFQLGLRNPYSMTFTDDGRLFISETGWVSNEEINVGEKGANFGWPFFEGADDGVLRRTPGYQNFAEAAAFYARVAAGETTITPAYRAFSHVNNDPGYQMSAIVGASQVYTGDKYPAVFRDDYFFTDIVDGEIYSVDVNDRTKLQFVTDVGAYGPAGFKQGPDGYLYMTDIANGRISRIEITDPNAPENSAPTVTSPIADRVATEDAAFSFTVPAAAFGDLDDDPLALSATLANGAPLPAWLAFDAETGTFSGTPGDAAVGTYQVAVMATDPAGASATDIFALTVTGVNDAPVVSQAIAQQSALPGTPFSFTLPATTFTDLDGDALTLTARRADGRALPAWLSFDPSTGTFAGTPPSGAGTLVIAVRAQDPTGAAVTDYFAVVVTTGNPAPVVENPIDNQAATAGRGFTFALPADTFADDDAFALSAKLTNGKALPAWLTFDPATGTFTGTPPDGPARRLAVSVTATDAEGASASDSFLIRIAAGSNRAPVVASPLADRTVAEEAGVSFALPANAFTDPDGNALTLTAALSSGAALPAWLTFDAATRTFSGTPDDPQVGTVAVRVTARDPAGASASDEFNLTVTPVNDAPTVANSIADRTATEGDAFSFVLPANTFADVDDPTLTVSASGAGGGALPAWLAFDPATRTFSGRPGAADVGAADVTVTARDAGGETAADTFRVTVGAAPTGETVYDDNPAANQTLTATGANDVFRIAAPSRGYEWGPTQDGSGIVIWNDAGFDLLFGFEAIRFSNKTVPLTSQIGPTYLDDPDVVQHLTGRSAEDTFVIAGPSSDYGWGPTESGQGLVLWTLSAEDDTFDVLTGFERVRFSDTTLNVADLLV